MNSQINSFDCGLPQNTPMCTIGASDFLNGKHINKNSFAKAAKFNCAGSTRVVNISRTMR